MEQQQSQMVRVKNSGILNYNGSPVGEDTEEEMTRSALSAFRAKEEEIERKKMEVKEKVQAHLGRVEEETKRLAEIREELQALADPMRKEVSIVGKKIDLANRVEATGTHLPEEGETSEKEYKEALEAFNEKSREKAQLLAKLMEMVNESERLRMTNLQELSKNIESLH